MKNLKTRIAAGATILGLGGLTGLALSAGQPEVGAGRGQAAGPHQGDPADDPRHQARQAEAPGGRRCGGAAGAGGGGGSGGCGSATTGASSTGSAVLSSSSSPAPVTTASSGASTSVPDLGLDLGAGRHPHQRLARRLARRPAVTAPRL